MAADQLKRFATRYIYTSFLAHYLRLRYLILKFSCAFLTASLPDAQVFLRFPLGFAA
jgi:hypothetical protein